MRILIFTVILAFCHLSFSQSKSGQHQANAVPIKDPNGFIELVSAPAKKFDGQIFLLNDWDGGDKDNQNAAEEMNRNSKIKEGVVLLSDYPNNKPKKLIIDDLVTDAHVVAKASKDGKIAIAMGAHSRHALKWLTTLPTENYNYSNIILVTHSNWNELDGKQGYEKNKIPGDPELVDTHGEKLRRGLYPNLARISDLGVEIIEIPRTDHGPGGWGGSIGNSGKKSASIKALDISDLGMVHYLKTGLVEATSSERNEFVSDIMKKTETLNGLNREVITKYWDSNHGVPGKLEDYQIGGKYYDNK